MLIHATATNIAKSIFQGLRTSDITTDSDPAGAAAPSHGNRHRGPLRGPRRPQRRATNRINTTLALHVASHQTIVNGDIECARSLPTTRDPVHRRPSSFPTGLGLAWAIAFGDNPQGDENCTCRKHRGIAVDCPVNIFRVLTIHSEAQWRADRPLLSET
jgi:hypothetical protein